MNKARVPKHFLHARMSQVRNHPDRPVLVYDGACSFCTGIANQLRRMSGDKVWYLSLQNREIKKRFPEIPRRQVESSVNLIETDGRVFVGTEAAFHALSQVRIWGKGLLWVYDHVPAFSSRAKRLYGWMARHRYQLSKALGSRRKSSAPRNRSARRRDRPSKAA